MFSNEVLKERITAAQLNARLRHVEPQLRQLQNDNALLVEKYWELKNVYQSLMADVKNITLIINVQDGHVSPILQQYLERVDEQQAKSQIEQRDQATSTRSEGNYNQNDPPTIPRLDEEVVPLMVHQAQEQIQEIRNEKEVLQTRLDSMILDYENLKTQQKVIIREFTYAEDDEIENIHLPVETLGVLPLEIFEWKQALKAKWQNQKHAYLSKIVFLEQRIAEQSLSYQSMINDNIASLMSIFRVNQGDFKHRIGLIQQTLQTVQLLINQLEIKMKDLQTAGLHLEQLLNHDFNRISERVIQLQQENDSLSTQYQGITSQVNVNPYLEHSKLAKRCQSLQELLNAYKQRQLTLVDNLAQIETLSLKELSSKEVAIKDRDVQIQQLRTELDAARESKMLQDFASNIRLKRLNDELREAKTTKEHVSEEAKKYEQIIQTIKVEHAKEKAIIATLESIEKIEKPQSQSAGVQTEPYEPRRRESHIEPVIKPQAIIKQPKQRSEPSYNYPHVKQYSKPSEPNKQLEEKIKLAEEESRRLKVVIQQLEEKVLMLQRALDRQNLKLATMDHDYERMKDRLGADLARAQIRGKGMEDRIFELEVRFKTQETELNKVRVEKEQQQNAFKEIYSENNVMINQLNREKDDMEQRLKAHLQMMEDQRSQNEDRIGQLLSQKQDLTIQAQTEIDRLNLRNRDLIDTMTPIIRLKDDLQQENQVQIKHLRELEGKVQTLSLTLGLNDQFIQRHVDSSAKKFRSVSVKSQGRKSMYTSSVSKFNDRLSTHQGDSEQLQQSLSMVNSEAPKRKYSGRQLEAMMQSRISRKMKQLLL